MKAAVSEADFLNGLRPEQSIYRYMSFAELRAIQKGQLRLTCPFKWADKKFGDPYENILFQAKVLRADGREIPARQHGRKFYAQCWTHARESDAMWRLYCEDNSGLKIKTTARELFSLVDDRFDPDFNEILETKIGRVKYLLIREIKANFLSADGFRRGIKDPHPAILFKRRAYSHEMEVRLIAYDFDDRNHRTDLSTTNLKGDPSNGYEMTIAIPKNSWTWIHEVVIDPRADPARVKVLTNELIEAGISKSKVKQSRLYGPRKIIIQLPSVS